MAQPSPYHLLSGESHIRVLQIDPNSVYCGALDAKNITCSLSEVDLRGCSYDSAFTALSYAWGSEEDSRQITLNGVMIGIRRNHYDFLVHAITQGWTRQLWIDALCINQNDEKEKSKQVALMGEIYSRASQVLIWLGPLDNLESDSLAELSKRSRYINRRHGTVLAKDLIHEMRPVELNMYLLSRESFEKSYNAEYRHGLVRILNNPYWKRKWIIQEVLLSGPNACIVTRDEPIPITELAREIYLFLDMFHHQALTDATFMKWIVDKASSDVSLDSTERRYAHERMSLARAFGYSEKRGKVDLESSLRFFWKAVVDVKMTYKSRPLMQLVDKFRDHLCSNPRDDIYALLGLSTLQPGSLVVDYSWPIDRLFKEVWSVVKNDLDGHDINCLKRVFRFGPYYEKEMRGS
jgi:hypothetical protein